MEENSSGLLDGRTDCRNCARRLIKLASRRVYILTQKLEPDLYNDREIFDHLTGLTTTNRKADIRVITHDTRTAASDGHYLINLAQKLPSFVQIRTTATRADRKFLESWLIIDDMAYMRLQNLAHYEGNFETNNRLECKSYIARFEQMWESCQVDQNTRRLSL
jgi:hypothetical protein